MTAVHERSNQYSPLIFAFVIAMMAHCLFLALALPEKNLSSSFSESMRITILAPSRLSPVLSERNNEAQPMAKTGQQKPETLSKTFLDHAETFSVKTTAAPSAKIKKNIRPVRKTPVDPVMLAPKILPLLPPLKIHTPADQAFLDNNAVQHPVPSPEKIGRVEKEAVATISKDAGRDLLNVREGANQDSQEVAVAAVPRYRDNPVPEYPRLAKRKGYEGRAVLEVEVFEDGTVGAVIVSV